MALDSRDSKKTSTPKTQAASPTASRDFAQSPARDSARKVAVVGGSAAGLLTASLLARQGVGVRVFERIETLEPAERTLIVTNRMRTLLGRAAEGCIVNEIRRFELFTDGRSATFELKQPDLIIERRALIQGLAEEARRAGAGLELGRRFHALHSNGRGLVLEVERCTDGSRERRDGRRWKLRRWCRRLCRCRKIWRRIPRECGSCRRILLIFTG
jgi:hypothetical protein